MNEEERKKVFRRILFHLDEASGEAWGMMDGTFERLYDIIEGVKKAVNAEYQRGHIVDVSSSGNTPTSTKEPTD